MELLPAFQIFGSEPREEETEMCFVDIAYDEIPERHYKESEVRRVKSLTSGYTRLCLYEHRVNESTHSAEIVKGRVRRRE